MKSIDIALKYYIDQVDFDSFIKRIGVPYFLEDGDIVIEDSNVDSILEWYYYDKDEREKKRKEQELKDKIDSEIAEAAYKRKAMANMLITSGFNFDGYRITKYSGYISGDDAMSVNRGYAWEKVSVRDELMKSLSQIRRNALRELKEAAYDLGCNAVIGVDFDYITLDPETANFSGGTTYQPYVFCVTANGNAVVIEKIEG